MRFYSTNHKSPTVSLKEAVLSGIAADGGLYLPEKIPVIPKAFFNNISEMSLAEMAFIVAQLVLGADIESAALKRIVYDTFTFDIPLTRVSPSIYGLELFHGPTLAFKDVGARFLARIISHLNGPKPENMKVIVATSGDSGGAVAKGFFGVPGVEVFVLYPSGRLTAMQRRQILELGGNVKAVEVHATFDECQKLARSAVTDPVLRSTMTLTTANSLNICRLLPQTFYFFYAYSRIMAHNPSGGAPVVAIPCGNLGNLTAALIAMNMGLPVKRLVAATNANDALLTYLRTGRFEPFRPVTTKASAMDVATPANLARISALCDGRFDRLSEQVNGVAASDETILSTIRRLWEESHYLCDPHGATAHYALTQNLGEGEQGIFLSTAHPSKFPDTIREATGLTLPAPDSRGRHRPRHPAPFHIPASLDALERLLMKS